MLDLKFTMYFGDKWVLDVTIDTMWDVIKESGMSKERPLREQLIISDYCVTDGIKEFYPVMEDTFGPWDVLSYAENLRNNWNNLDKFIAVDNLFYDEYTKSWDTENVFCAHEDEFEYVDEGFCLIAFEN